MPKLTDQQKDFIIDRLAMYDTPNMVSKALKEEFGIDVPRNQVEGYHPNSYRGRGGRSEDSRSGALGKRLRARFDAAREAFEKDVASIPIMHRNYRLRKLNDMFEAAFDKKNHPMAAKYLEQAAKEMGDSFAAVKRLEIDHSGKIATEDVTTGDKRDMILTRFLDAAQSIAAEAADRAAATKH